MNPCWWMRPLFFWILSTFVSWFLSYTTSLFDVFVASWRALAPHVLHLCLVVPSLFVVLIPHFSHVYCISFVISPHYISISLFSIYYSHTSFHFVTSSYHDPQSA
eukprot:1011203_1